MTLNDYADWSIPDLFDELISYCAGNIGDDTTEAIKAAITSKARSEGKAEGAEQERERIIRGSERLPEGTDVEVSEYFGIAYGVHEDVELSNSEVFIIPASVLAPTKEGVLQKQMEEQVMEDQQKEDMLAEDLKRHQQQDDRERWARENP